MTTAPHFCYRTGLTGLLLLLGYYSGRAQQPLDQWQHQLETHRRQTLQEKLFVHTDQSFYMAGERLWCRLFYVDGSFHRPLDVSKVAYLELLNNEQKAVLQTKITLDTGKGAGSLSLPKSLASGSYILRAYTHWMKTVSPDFFFEKTITIVNPFRRLGLPPLTDSLAYAVQFFPEGGNLVADLPAKVAFKVVDPKSGRGVDCRGVLLSEANDTVARFSTLRFGMGTFSFTPLAAKAYRVLLTDSRGRPLSRPLPASDATGYTLQIDEVGTEQFRVTVRTNLPVGQSGSAVYLVGHTRQVIKVAEMQPLQNGLARFVVDKHRLGDGISHLTVFDAATRPVCERLYFKRPLPGLVFGIRPDKMEYTTRAPVVLTLTGTDPAGTPLAADASVSVYRLDSLPPGEATTLPAYLWLTSDLPGPIESPDAYLTTTGPDADAALDNLMLTHGWRRFRWDGRTPTLPANEPVPEHSGLTIRGRVTHAHTGAPAPGVITYLSVPGKAVQLMSSRSDAQGLVRFEPDAFPGSKELVLQTAGADSTLHLDYLNPFAETGTTTPLPVFDLSETLAGPLAGRSLAMQVQNSYPGSYAPKPPPAGVDSTAFYGTPDERYALDAFTRFTVMEEVLSEYVPGVLVRRRSRQYALRVYNTPYKEVFSEAPLVLLDGVPVFDTDRLMAFSPLKIKTLDVLTRRYFLGYAAFAGIVSFKTYAGNLAGFQLGPQAVTLEYDGLQARREFYAPVYATPQQQASRLPDLRNLLYWNPHVTTGAAGTASLPFYTGDQAGTYLIMVQGLTADGRAGSAQQVIPVRPLLK